MRWKRLSENYLKPDFYTPVAYQVWAVLRGGPFLIITPLINIRT